MKYDGLNRVFRVYVDRQDFLYVATSPAKALALHVAREGKRKGLAAEEVSPTRNICVPYNNCAEAIAVIYGVTPDVVRPSLEGVRLADEYIGVRRAAEQWARLLPTGETSFLAVL